MRSKIFLIAVAAGLAALCWVAWQAEAENGFNDKWILIVLFPWACLLFVQALFLSWAWPIHGQRNDSKRARRRKYAMRASFGVGALPLLFFAIIVGATSLESSGWLRENRVAANVVGVAIPMIALLIAATIPLKIITSLLFRSKGDPRPAVWARWIVLVNCLFPVVGFPVASMIWDL